MLQLDVLFSDHAVFQCGVLVPLWGESEPNTDIEVTLNGIQGHATVSSTGRWLLHLPPMPAGGPFDLKVENMVTGETLSRSDIMLGEVWLASGQSNMEFTLDRNVPQPQTLSRNLRIFAVPQATNPGAGHGISSEWICADRQDAWKKFSAAGAFFGEELARQTGHAVGVICSSFGGSDALCWVSREGLLGSPEFGGAMRDYMERVSRVDYSPLEDAIENPHVIDYYREHPLPPEAERGLRENWYSRDYDDSAWGIASLPAPWGAFTDDANGAFWFRRTVTIPETWRGKNLQISLGSADKQDITFVNGHEIGRTGTGFCEASWNLNRRYRVPADLTQDGILVIAVRVYSFFMDGGLIGKAGDMFLTDNHEQISLAGDWRYCREFSLGRVRSIAPNDSGRPLPYYLLPDNTPGLLFENMIRPLLPFAIRGVVWFQGEHNTIHRPETYADLMRLLVRDWRYHFGNPSLPFHQVSLANYHAPAAYDENSTWAPVRDIQHKLGHEIQSLTIPAYEQGEADEIHFPDKRGVGARLAYSALCEDYGLIPNPFPVVRGIRCETDSNGKRLVIECSHADGLHLQDGATLFRIADLEHRDFIPCHAFINGNSIVLDVPESIRRPRYVRYAWADCPEGAIVLAASGCPLEPFEYLLP